MRNSTTTEQFLVVFDKDGTLIDFDVMWANWAENHAAAIVEHVVRPCCSTDVDATCRRFTAAYFEALDYDAKARHVGAKGVLACSPMSEIDGVAADVAARFVDPATERAVIDAAVRAASEAASPDPAAAVPRADLGPLFDAIAAMGAEIAVCTTDDRAPTEATLAHLGLTKYVVAMSCGDDGVVEAKPSRAQIDVLRSACRAAPPQCTVMVGDTPKDMLLGQNAECDLVVGILGGASGVSDLVEYADCVIDGLERLPKLLALVFSAARARDAAVGSD